MRPIGLLIVVNSIIKSSGDLSVLSSRNFLAISLIVVNLCSCTVSGLDQNTSLALESWFNGNESEYDEIISSCMDKCAYEDKYYGNLQTVGCKSYKDLCSIGCNKWKLSALSTCDHVCHDDTTWHNNVSPCDIACISGCKEAVFSVMEHLKKSPDFQTAPVLLNDTVNGTSLTLSWPIGPQRVYSTERLLIQWSYVDVPEKWWYSWTFHWVDSHTCIVDKLQPYTKYRFRITMMVTSDHSNFVFSTESGVLQTSPWGLPSSEPEITEVFALDHDKIAVFWKPGRFINAPLNGFKVKAKVLNSNSSIEMVVNSTDTYTILDHLEPQQSYDLAVAMINSFGEGPSAMETISTGSTPGEVKNPAFIVAGEYKVILVNTSADGSIARELYKSDHPILGFDVLIDQQTFFVSDDTGHVYRINMQTEGERDAIISPKFAGNIKPSKMSVDWLNSYLYTVVEVKSDGTWLISRTGFTANGPKIMVEGLREKPVELYADPLNGLIFWITLESGIFRLDLADLSWANVYKAQGLHTLAVDPERTLLHTFSKMDRKLLKISYDGKFVFEAGIEVSSEMIVGLVQYNSILYWTDGKQIYSNQSITVLFDSCAILKLFQPSAQLMPSPADAPTKVQALLTADTAKLSWKSPKKGYFQGAAAWSGWNFDLEVKEGEVSVAIRNIKTEFFTVEKLKPNTEYWFRVRATALNGADGPWSEWFRSETWVSSEGRYLLWATNIGLLRSNEARDSIETMLNGSVRSLSWVNESLYLVKESQVFLWDMGNLTTIVEDTVVGRIAYDWKGQKLYFTDESKRALVRASLDGSERELLPIFGITNMELDSENGYIYYSTGLRIEACGLSGSPCVTYYKASLFADEFPVGIALDLQNRLVLWTTQSDDETYLYSAPMAHVMKDVGSPVMTPLEGPPVESWFSYLSGRLVWSTNATTLVIANEKGENQAFFASEVTTYGVQVVEPSQRLDALYSVTPEAVNASSIKVIGLWDNFNITWDPVQPDSGYKVIYFIKIEENLFRQTFEPSIHYPHSDLTPYSPLKVWITVASPWSRGNTTTLDVFSPTAAPSEPQRLRAFANRIHNPLLGDQNISAVVRWESPEEPNGPIVLYSITCQKGNETFAIQNSTDLEAIFWGLEENTTYSFQAQAFTSGAGGAASKMISISVDSEFQSVPRLLLATADHIGLLDMDLNSTEVFTKTNDSTRHLVVIREENHLIWINKAGKLMSNFRGNVSVLSFLEADAQALTVDWIARIVFWSQADQGGGSTIHSLDLNQFEGEPLSGQLLISNPKPIKDLVILPLSQTLLWLERDGSLSGWNLREMSEINLLLETNSTFENMYPGSFERDVESVMLVSEKGTICMLILQHKTCQVLKIGVDTENQHLAWDNGFVYALKLRSIRAYERQRQSLEYMVNMEDVSVITALSLQPYPERRCLLPDFEEEPLVETNLLVPQLVNSTKHSLELRFPRISPPQGCGFKIPGLKYNLLLRESGREEVGARDIHSFEPKMNVTALTPFSKYTVQLEISNYYADKLGYPKVLGPAVRFVTAPGTPSTPRNVTVQAVSPRDGLVQWVHPEVLNNDRVWYEIHWQTENPNNGVVHRHKKIVPEGEDKWNSFLLSGLRPDHMYLVWIKVFSTEMAFNTSETYNFETFPEPEGLAFVDSTAYSLTVNWNSSTNITSAFLLYSPLDLDDAISVNITGDSHARVIESLEPKTKYSFHLKLFYSHSVHPYVWPPDSRFVFETLADRPDAPGQPLIRHIKREVFNIFWEPARNNGAPIQEYSLEALQSSQVKRVRRSHYFAQDDDLRVSNKTMARLGQLPWAEEIEPVQDKWIPYCNGTNTNCIITELHTMRLLMFRVRARNSFGWGPYSPDSEMIAEPFVSPRKRDTLVFAIIAPITIVATCVTLAVLVRYVHGRRKHAKKLLYESRPSIWGLDVATLQQVARSRNFSQTSSMLYTGKPLTDGDIALLPQINRGQIDMHKFLGSGAFGEVYEGLVTYLDDGSQDRVAIKTLRKGSSEQEKTELLQEAHLMSHFKHENIVKLIGVCFDLDSICIIMELMEGGDLQTYLRQARPTLSKLGSLSLLELVGMCLDVCTGCRYLEDLHFLHRDLACRNCLVSSVDPQFRVVKIGDFGLARDIYKSDYYRKEGEGLLPVRWMAPECLVDGVFTSQSDIWSFGILLWEILSLGQQPYPAQSNLEVLNFVKEGGRLQQPQECPDELYKLMIQCWVHDPDDRPTFQQCLNELMSMKLAVLNKKHTSDFEEGITNMSFAESDDDEGNSKVSFSSRANNPSSLHGSFTGEVMSNQRNQPEGSGSELMSFKVSTPTDAEEDGSQPKRKSVHYVNEGQSKF